MSTLYLDRKNLTVKLDGYALAFYEEGAKRGTVPFNMLEKIVIRGNINLESRLLCALGEHHVDVLLLSGRSSQRRAMAFSHKHNDVKRRLAQYKVFFEPALQFDLASKLVLAKIDKQLHFLDHILQIRSDLRKPVFSALKTLKEIRATVVNLHSDESALANLRGYEGAAAASYFAAFKQLFAPSLAFNKRIKRPPVDPVNACLSLGYTLLHFEAVGICYMVGLEPLLGFYHDPSLGRDSLACDLIEPLRPRLDALVWSLFRDRELRLENFVFENNRCLLNKSGRKCFYSHYEAFVHPIRRLLRLQGHQLAKFYLQTESGLAL